MSDGRGVRKNMSKFDFVFWHILGAIWSRYFYLKFFDGIHTIAGCSPLKSYIILIGLIVGCNIIGTVLRMKTYRKWVIVCMDCLMPYGVFTVLVNWQERRTVFVSGLSVAGGLTFFYLLLVFGRRIRNRTKRKKILLARTHRGLVGGYHLFCTLFVLFAACGAIGCLQSKRTMQANVEATQQEMQILDAEAVGAELVKLHEDVWCKMTLQERLDLLQVVANLEQQYLGIPQSLEVRIKTLDCGVLGSYEDFSWRIYVDRALVEEGSSWQALVTIFHEAYHAYEHRMVDAYEKLGEEHRTLLAFREAKVYAQEFEEYIDSGDDVTGYYVQECEEDARNYSERRVLEYYEALTECEEEMSATQGKEKK